MAKKISVSDIQMMMDDYVTIHDFVSQYPKITLAEFDHYSVSDMSLFVVREDLDFNQINNIIDTINSCLPAINRIFIKPIIQLVELNEVVPIEAVRTVNNKTMQHIAVHSELWDNITDDGIKPQKLMSRIYQDNYSIYENIVFTKTINEILSFLRKTRRNFENLLYASKILEYNILERVNHLNYFLAIGKLHTGYIRGFDKYYESIKPIYDKLTHTYDKVSSKLKYNVYKKNKNFKGKLILRQTNILHMQKDYHKVYNLLKYFEKNNILTKELKETDYKTFDRNYYNFCNMLLIFSLMHFGFSCNKDLIIDLENTDTTFTYKKWIINIKKLSNEKDYILVEFLKEKYYRIVLDPIFLEYTNLDYNYPEFNERIILSPLENLRNTTYISIYDIDSFRKLQQIILRGMIKSSTVYDVCPFCGGDLEKDEHSEKDEESYLCKSCNTHLGIRSCELTKEKYIYSDIYKFNYSLYDEELSIDALYHYRNITKMTKNGDIVCPICNKVHSK